MKNTIQRHDGQAVIEYMLLSAIVMLIFGAVFLMARKQVYYLWVCDLMPRIQSPVGCAATDTDCAGTIYSKYPKLKQKVGGLIDMCPKS